MTSNKNILDSIKFKCMVSSVLNKDIRQHGKTFMFDNEEDTSWSSDQGTPQIIHIQFDEPQNLSSFGVQFQGGFVGKDSLVSITNKEGTSLYEEPFYPDDINSTQYFSLKKIINGAYRIKLTFNSSTDFFGRIIVYKLELY